MKKVFFGSLLAIIGLVIACTKNPTPAPPIHDTTVIVKTDTVTVLPKLDSSINLKKGLLLFMPFSNSIADSSGNCNPTQAVTPAGGSVLGYDEHGFANNAFNGAGNGTRIKVTNNGSIKFDTAFSLSYDVMIKSAGRQAILTMINTATGNGPTFLSSTTISGLPNLDFYVNDISSDCDVVGPSNSLSVGDTASVPQIGSWYNVVNIYHKGTVQTYVNGVLMGSVKGLGTAALLCPQAQIVIGGWWDNDPITINGSIDEVRLYNRVLNPAEITYLSRNFQVVTTKVHTAPVIR